MTPAQRAKLADAGHRRHVDEGQGRPDGPSVRRRPGRERLHGVAFVRRARWHPRPDVCRRGTRTPTSPRWSRSARPARAGRSWRSSSPAAPAPTRTAPARRCSTASTQHAREWIATEVNRRLMNWYVDQWNADDPAVKKLLRTTELWFVLVANPDGYQYTFDAERLWRKNLRDNNGDGVTQVGDGVDPNRNFPNHWGYDNEGSSDIPSSDTYRGPAPASEPETTAITRLMRPRSGSPSRSTGTPPVSGCSTPTAGRSERLPPTTRSTTHVRQPRRVGDPGLPTRAELRRPLRHQRRDHRLRARCRGHARLDAGAVRGLRRAADSSSPTTRPWCRRSSSGCCRSRKSAADSARDPAHPKSALGLETKPFYLKSDDPYKEGVPGANFTFEYSYGDPQPVASSPCAASARSP